MGVILGVMCAAAVPARAQDGGIVLEGGTARSLPPSGVGLDAATYAMGGLRLDWGGPPAWLLQRWRIRRSGDRRRGQ